MPIVPPVTTATFPARQSERKGDGMLQKIVQKYCGKLPGRTILVHILRKRRWRMYVWSFIRTSPKSCPRTYFDLRLYCYTITVLRSMSIAPAELDSCHSNR
eukprot:scaffold22800_cov204-Cylindrotheca_fusiformis.AAC.2